MKKGDPYIGIELASITFLNDYKDIIWWSERTGHGHLYHYDGEGNLKNVITSGNWTAGKVVSIDEKNRTVYFQAYGVTPGKIPVTRRFVKLTLTGREKWLFSLAEEATHNVIFCPSKRFIIDAFSRPDLPYQFTVRDTRQGDLVFKLSELDLNDMYKQGWKMPETFSVKAADGETDLYGVMWKPFDFDSTKRYPIISCVYPGPQTDNVPLTFEVGSTNVGFGSGWLYRCCFQSSGWTPAPGTRVSFLRLQ